MKDKEEGKTEKDYMGDGLYNDVVIMYSKQPFFFFCISAVFEDWVFIWVSLDGLINHFLIRMLE